MDRRAALSWLSSGFLAAAGLALRSAPAAAARHGEALFGYSARPGGTKLAFPKWRGALSRYFDERALLERPCDRRMFDACQLHRWERFLEDLESRTRDPTEQVRAVHLEMNEHDYILDQINWGVPDYWASPGEFLRKHGDCEDFAIAKFMSLRRLGFSADSMSVVVVHDLNLRIPHAVMALRHGGDTLILDNQIDRPVSHRLIRHYRPVYAVSENFWTVFTRGTG